MTKIKLLILPLIACNMLSLSYGMEENIENLGNSSVQERLSELKTERQQEPKVKKTKPSNIRGNISQQSDQTSLLLGKMIENVMEKDTNQSSRFDDTDINNLINNIGDYQKADCLFGVETYFLNHYSDKKININENMLNNIAQNFVDSYSNLDLNTRVEINNTVMDLCKGIIGKIADSPKKRMLSSLFGGDLNQDGQLSFDQTCISNIAEILYDYNKNYRKNLQGSASNKKKQELIKARNLLTDLLSIKQNMTKIKTLLSQSNDKSDQNIVSMILDAENTFGFIGISKELGDTKAFDNIQKTQIFTEDQALNDLKKSSFIRKSSPNTYSIFSTDNQNALKSSPKVLGKSSDAARYAKAARKLKKDSKEK